MRLVSALLLTLTIGTGSSLASTSSVARQWAQSLSDTSVLLRDGKFSEARSRLERLKRDMLAKLGPGEAADRLFAIVIGQLAVAEAGSGRTDEAIWTWHIAQNIHRDVRDVDLSAYGNAGKLLASHVLPSPPDKCARLMLQNPPIVRNRVEPTYPEGVRQFRESGITIVQIRLTEEGVPTEPQVLKALAAPITYAALDALRHWRFESAKGATSVSTDPFCITFNFRLR